MYTTRKTKAQIMDGIESTSSKIIARNTVRYTQPNGVDVIRYHETDVLRLYHDGAIRIDTGGWPTKTTRERINMGLPKGWYTFQENSQMWIRTPRNTYPVIDGCIFKKSGIPINKIPTKEKTETKIRQDKKLVSAYIRKFIKELPQIMEGTSGDPWVCPDEKGHYPEDAMRTWLDEKYVFTSFLAQALKFSGYRHDQWAYVSRIEDVVKRSLRKLAMASLGYSH